MQVRGQWAPRTTIIPAVFSSSSVATRIKLLERVADPSLMRSLGMWLASKTERWILHGGRITNPLG